jgi:tRNA (guanine37-N1)-methyltransferase
LVILADKAGRRSLFLAITEREGFPYRLLHTKEGNFRSLMIEFDILTLFPGLCEGAFSESILGKAQENRLIQVRCLDLRRWASGKHRVTDEPPYGGGPGMVMKAEPIFAAVEAIRRPGSHVILMSATGPRFTQQKAQELVKKSHLLFVCGHYEGVDQRVADHVVDEELSIGDYILTNGAIAATVVVDAVARLIPGVLGEADSATDESFSDGLLEYPHYTRPADFRGLKVPEILLSGNHAAIEAWRKAEAVKRTVERRPGLAPDLAPSSKLQTPPRRLDSERVRQASREATSSKPGTSASSRSAVNEES